jgi:hypothetical protein
LFKSLDCEIVQRRHVTHRNRWLAKYGIDGYQMKRRSLIGSVLNAMTKVAFAFFVALLMRTPGSLAQAEEPSAAAVRFYGEYMGMGVALKPLGERWFTARFRGVMDAFDEGDSATLPIRTEGNPILPWKNWDTSWRHKLKAEALHASSHQALVVITFATDENGRPIARLVHLERMGDGWRVDDVTDPPR